MITLVLSLEQLRVIDEAVQQLPFKVAAPLIQHINQELLKPINNPAKAEESSRGLASNDSIY